MRRKGKIVNRKKYQNGRSLFRWISTGMNKTIDPYMESVMADAISLASDHKICEFHHIERRFGGVRDCRQQRLRESRMAYQTEVRMKSN